MVSSLSPYTSRLVMDCWATDKPGYPGGIVRDSLSPGAGLLMKMVALLIM